MHDPNLGELEFLFIIAWLRSASLIEGGEEARILALAEVESWIPSLIACREWKRSKAVNGYGTDG
jgi:hypothetical protein